MFREFDGAVNRACVHVWRVRESGSCRRKTIVRRAFCTSRAIHGRAAQARILRRL